MSEDVKFWIWILRTDDGESEYYASEETAREEQYARALEYVGAIGGDINNSEEVDRALRDYAWIKRVPVY